MKTIGVYMADNISNDKNATFGIVEPATIIIDHKLPEFETPKGQSFIFDDEAKAIEKILNDTLPGGVYAALLVAMLNRRRTHFRISGAKE